MTPKETWSRGDYGMPIGTVPPRVKYGRGLHGSGGDDPTDTVITWRHVMPDGSESEHDSHPGLPEQSPPDYGGYWPPRDRQGYWLQMFTYSDLADDNLGAANYASAIETLEALGECPLTRHRDDGPCWEEQRFGSWAYRHYDTIWMRVDCPTVGPVALEFSRALIDYPVLDEDKLSELELEQVASELSWLEDWEQEYALSAIYGTGSDHDRCLSLADSIAYESRQWDDHMRGPFNIRAVVEHVIDGQPLPAMAGALLETLRETQRQALELEHDAPGSAVGFLLRTIAAIVESKDLDAIDLPAPIAYAHPMPLL